MFWKHKKGTNFPSVSCFLPWGQCWENIKSGHILRHLNPRATVDFQLTLRSHLRICSAQDVHPRSEGPTEARIIG